MPEAEARVAVAKVEAKVQEAIPIGQVELEIHLAVAEETIHHQNSKTYIIRFPMC